jgi:hypothetical protein
MHARQATIATAGGRHDWHRRSQNLSRRVTGFHDLPSTAAILPKTHHNADYGVALWLSGATTA